MVACAQCACANPASSLSLNQHPRFPGSPSHLVSFPAISITSARTIFDERAAPLLRSRVVWIERVLAGAVVLFLLTLPHDDGTTAARGACAVLIPLLVAVLTALERTNLEHARKFFGAACFLLAVFAISASRSLDPGYSFKTFFGQGLPNMAVFIAVLVWAAGGEDRRLLVLRTMTLSAAVVGALTMYGYYSGDDVYKAQDSLGNIYFRAKGPYDSYSRTAMYAIFTAPCCAGVMALARGSRRFAECALSGVALALLLWGTALTQTRGAWAACAFAVLPLLARFSPWGVLTLFCGAVIGGSFLESVRTRLVSQIHDLGDPETFFSGRFFIYKTGIQAIKENPITGIGYGPNIFLTPAAREAHSLLTYVQQPDLHQFYLQQLAETGVLGALAFLLIGGIWVRIIWRAHPWRTFHRANPDPGMILTAAFAMGVIGLLVYGMIGNFYEERNAFFFWIMAAMAAGPVLKRATADHS